MTLHGCRNPPEALGDDSIADPATRALRRDGEIIGGGGRATVPQGRRRPASRCSPGNLAWGDAALQIRAGCGASSTAGSPH